MVLPTSIPIAGTWTLLKKSLKVLRPLLLPLLILGILVGSIHWYSDSMYKKGQADRKAIERKIDDQSIARQDAMAQQIKQAVVEIRRNTDERIEEIDAINNHTTTVIEKEFAEAPQLAQEDSGYSRELVDAINKLIAESHS